MKYKNLILTMFISVVIVMLSLTNLLFEMSIILWMLVLWLSYMKSKNHFITLLLILEMFSLSSIFMSLFFMKTYMNLSFIFILMSLSVGEAVMGLALLVKVIRFSSNERMVTNMM